MKIDQDTPIADNDDNEQEEKEITETIEEIIPTDTTSSGKTEQVVYDSDNQYACFNCGYRMIEQKACMLKCINCGSVKDCSETAIW